MEDQKQQTPIGDENTKHDIVDMAKSTKKAKNNKPILKLFKKRWVRVTSISLLIIAIFVGGFFLIDYIIKQSASIKIGDNTLTKKEVTNYQNSLQDYYDNNPDVSTPNGKDVATLAQEELIMNLALKAYQQKCDVSEPSDDDLRATGLNVDSGLDFVRIRAENQYYQDKMSSCIINNKKILRVAIMYDTPYFVNLESQSQELAETTFNEAKKKLEDEFLPLFSNGTSATEIANMTDLDNTKDPGEAHVDMNSWHADYRTIAWLDNYNNEVSQYNDQSGSEWTFDVGDMKSANSEAGKLDKVGDVSGVFTGKNGEIVLMRLESKTGEFNTWNDFLEDAKTKSEENTKSNILSYIAPDAYAVNVRSTDVNGNLTANVDIDSVNFYGGNAYATNSNMGSQPCYAYNYWNNDIGSAGKIRTTHNMVFIWNVKDNYGNPVQGATVKSTQPTSACGYTSQDKTDASGRAYSVATCNTFEPQLSITIPSGYSKQSNTDSEAAATGGNWSGSNGTSPRTKNITINKNSSWSVSGSSNVDNPTDSTGWIQGDGGSVPYTSGLVIGFHNNLSASGNAGGQVNITVDKYVGDQISTDRLTGSGWSNLGVQNKNGVTFSAGQSGFNNGGSFNAAGGWHFGVGINASDIGKYVCININWTWSNSSSSGSWGRSKPACIKIVAAPWQLDPSTQIKSDGTNKEYVSKDIKVVAGETITWQHTASNTTSYAAPGINGSHGYNRFGYYLEYGDSAQVPGVKPTGGQNFGGFNGNRYVGWDATMIGDIGKGSANGEKKTVDSDKSDNIGGTGGITGIYSQNNNNQPPTSYTVKSTDTGKLFCQAAYVTYNKDTSLGGKRTLADWRCAYVPYDYELVPCIAAEKASCGGTDIPKEPGETTTTTPKIKNDSSSTTKESTWKITSWEVSGGDESIKTPSSNTDNTSSDTCATYNSLYNGKAVGCESSHTGSGTFNEGETTLSSVINSFTVPDTAELGSRYCFALSINNYKFTESEDQTQQADKTNQWRHGAPLCILVTKKPKMQVWGGNVWSTGGVQTSTTSISGNTYGSWIEYDVFSKKANTGIASASGTSNGILNSLASQPKQVSRLTAGRTSSVMYGGSYVSDWANSPTGMIDNIRSRFSTTGAQTTWNTSKIQATGTPTVFNINKDLTISGFSLGDNQSAIVYVNGSVTISGNIDMAAGFTPSIKNQPQLIIVATKDIKINNNVSTVDAWLLASNGEVKTCNVSNLTSVNAQICGNSLKINGPVVAKNVRSWRTAGSDATNRSASAEIYNLSADNLQWIYAQGSGNGKVFTQYSKELPVRF